MKTIENMVLSELEIEKQMQLRRIDSAQAAIETISGKKDYSDELAKYFHLGKVGFRRDAKKQNVTLNRAIDNGVKACGYYEKIKEARDKLKAIERAVNFITENKTYGETVRQIKEKRYKASLESAKAIKWEKVLGHYGMAYKHGNFIVERIDAGFVAVRDIEGNLLTHCKTVKEAKATVSLAVARQYTIWKEVKK